MIDFRRKIFLGNFLLVLIFLALLFPIVEMSLHKRCELCFLLAGFLLIVLYGCVTWIMIRRITRPIQEIIKAMEPHQEEGWKSSSGDELGKLARILNSLSLRVHKQIERLIAQSNETEAILDALGEGVIAINLQGVIAFANATSCSMLLVARDGFLNASCLSIQVGRKDLWQKVLQLIEQVSESKEQAREPFLIEEKQTLCFHINVISLVKPSLYIVVLQDKTSDYRMIEMGKEFIANASHELRTPITVIRGFSEMLLDAHKFSSEQLQEIFLRIANTSIRLDSLVKSLLTLADLERMGIEKFSKINFSTFSKRCLDLFLSTHPEAKIELVQDVKDVYIFAESDLLEMAVFNLLQNAIKYSPPHAKTEIALSESEQSAHLSVIDRGIGISEQDLPRLFDRFYTVDKARSRKLGGAGLGLSIVKTVLETHAGKVEVSSQLGHGSKFTIILPIQSA